MDPEETVRLIEAAFKAWTEGESPTAMREAAEHTHALANWLAMDGFVPRNLTDLVPCLAIAIQEMVTTEIEAEQINTGICPSCDESPCICVIGCNRCSESPCVCPGVFGRNPAGARSEEGGSDEVS